jgi:Fe2+ transport system protein FeoA
MRNYHCLFFRRITHIYFSRFLRTPPTFAVFGILSTPTMQRRYRTIADLKMNESALTLAFNDPALAGKLTAMGILPGTRIELVRPAPFGDAYYIKADGVRLALRKEEAASILLEI